ncbi:MAG: NAD(P)H-hydrate dehydratase [Gemmatimonadaceae bacterium]
MGGVRVVDAAGAAARDAEAIAAGIPSRALMQRAAAAAAGEIARRYAGVVRRGVAIYAGPGNNGGDAWAVARALAASGVPVRVASAAEPRTDDARFERELASHIPGDDGNGAPPLVVDGLLGTGARGEPRGEIAVAIERLERAREAGATVVSLDMPSGVDASTGGGGLAVHADLTLTFGTMKRGLLVARARAGRIAVLDIGLLPGADADASPTLVAAEWVRSATPPIPPDAHKGTRKRLVIVGGAPGMAGAAALAAQAALRSGIGMVRVLVAPESVGAAQCVVPEAVAHAWPEDDDAAHHVTADWADCLLIGPGLGDTTAARALVERLLRVWNGPTVLDADALNVFRGQLPLLGQLLAGRPALLTPHPAEAARLVNGEVSDVLARRFDLPSEMARSVRGAVLLKGIPTVIASPDGRSLVSAAGSAALAAAGSGDVLGGIAATLLAQGCDPTEAGAAAAWAHGRAGELAGRGGVRGATLADVLREVPTVWREPADPPAYPVLVELESAGAEA